MTSPLVKPQGQPWDHSLDLEQRRWLSEHSGEPEACDPVIRGPGWGQRGSLLSGKVPLQDPLPT